MLTDAHCHPFDLAGYFPNAESERRQLGIMCIASASNPEEFEFCEKLALQAEKAAALPILPCFAIHPQMSVNKEQLTINKDHFAFLDKLAAEKRIIAVGETGFDLYNAVFRETEQWQDKMFAGHLEIALRYNLPVVIHVRKAMNKIFSQTAVLKKCPAVICHS